jgi:tryptophan-rich sensory protein
MGKKLDRVLLTVLGVAAAFTGVWAYGAPRSWYENFPGFGLSWLPQLGPYNEHFCKDTGAMFLALLVLSAAAIVYVDNRTVVKIAAGAWLTFNVLHFAYHMTMLQMYNTRDAVLNVILLSVLVLVSAALLIPDRAMKRDAARPARGDERTTAAPKVS